MNDDIQSPGEVHPEYIPSVKTVIFEDLTLSEALGYLVWRPGETLSLLWKVLTRDAAAEPDYQAAPDPAIFRKDRGAGEGEPSFVRFVDDTAYAEEAAVETYETIPDAEPVLVAEEAAAEERIDLRGNVQLAVLRLVVLGVALLLAVKGGDALHDATLDPVLHAQGDTGGARLWFVMASALYLGFELFVSRAWWVQRFPRVAAFLRGPETGTFRRRFEPVFLVALALVIVWLVMIASGNLLDLAVWLALALLLWLAAVISVIPPEIPVRRAAPRPAADDSLVIAPRQRRDARPGSRRAWLDRQVFQLVLVPPALLLSAAAYSANVTRDAWDQASDVSLTTGGFVAWVASIALWVLILAVDVRRLPRGVVALLKMGPGAIMDRLRAANSGAAWRARLPGLGTLAALAAITTLGAIFRLYDLASTPPEMTSDHIEKLLDALRISDGARSVFFPNNGGREGFQMYVVAFIADTLKVGFNFKALKLATAIEGVITLPALWWMARQVCGTSTARSRQLGNWIGLALAGLVAISSWHVMLSRLGLRIVLTPLTTALVIGFVARVMRHNRMRDYVALGLVLGAGVYFYQANRMLPLVVLIGVGLALVDHIRQPRDLPQLVAEVLGFAALALSPVLIYWYAARVLEQSGYRNPHDLGERMGALMPVIGMAWFSVLALIVRARRRDAVLQYGGGVLAVAVIALAVYIPMYHYSELHSAEFWNRTRGRLFGEDAFWRIDPDTGVKVSVEPSVGDQIERFWDQRDVFVDNYQDALRMFHWEGDGAWISNAESRPALGGLSGGLVVLGAVMWGAWTVRRGDPVWWMMLLAGLMMLLPSAMTLAYQIENPSFTRASGAIPVVFALAALPVGVLCWRLTRLPVGVRGVPVGALVAVILVVGLLGRGLGPNWSNFFSAYRLSYSYSWKPYREIAKPLRVFAEGEGSYGNAFMIAFPHWLDHRILGAMAGDIRWPNGLTSREKVFEAVARNQGTPYEYDPEKPVFFMYHVGDAETTDFLKLNFPGGVQELYQYNYEVASGYLQDQYYIYRVHIGLMPSAPLETAN